jgi:LAGLIDADG endonuclease
LIGLKSYINWGLSDKLKQVFPNVATVSRPIYKFNGIPNPFWVAGFTSGDGSFHINIKESNTVLGHRVSLRFSINLNIRDIEVLKGLVTYFNDVKTFLNSVKLQEDKHVYEFKNTTNLSITKISDLINVIIPFFYKYPIQGLKSLDLADFKKVAVMIDNKEHLTIEGLNRIIKIKLNMNKHRLW